jgi:bifunctional DNase/RNase
MTMTKCAKAACGHDANGAVCVVVHCDGEPTELAFCPDHMGDAELDYMLRDPRQSQIHCATAAYEVCKLHKLVFLHGSQEYFVILRSVHTQAIFLMQTGYVEACSIYGAINRPDHPIPLTYQLFENLVHMLNGSIIEAVFDGYNKDYQAYENHLVIGKQDGVAEVPCRGSDAVGIAFLAKTPIKVNTSFLGHVLRP